MLTLVMNFVWHLGLFIFVFKYKSSDNATVIYSLYFEHPIPN